FINNTTYGCIGDSMGVFELKRFPSLPFSLTITAVGYESVLLPIKGDHFNQNLIVSLKAKVMNLKEVTVRNPEPNGWEQYGQRFKEEFIGYSQFADQCEILNKEVLE